MPIFRVNKTSDYTIMSNAHFKEKSMSLKAKGLLSLMLSLPDDWDYSIRGLVAICKENESAIKTALNELKTFGYLEITKKNPNETESGRIEYEYNVYEQPQKKQPEEKQGVENLPTENQGVEKPAQLNTKKQNTKELKTNDKKIKDIGASEDATAKKQQKRFVKPTVEEIREYCISRKNNVNPEKFFNHYESNGWKVGKNNMKDWKAAVRTWEQNEFGNNQNGGGMRGRNEQTGRNISETWVNKHGVVL